MNVATGDEISVGNILIVGGGPAGLATALELRTLGMDITIVERAASCTAMDPERAFLYLIDGRGLKFTDAHGLTPLIQEQGVPGNQFNLTVCRPFKPRVTTALNLVDDQKRVPYWLPRDRFVAILADAVRSAASAAAANGQRIRILEGWELAALERDGAHALRATLRRSAAADAADASGAGEESLSVSPVVIPPHTTPPYRLPRPS